MRAIVVVLSSAAMARHTSAILATPSRDSRMLLVFTSLQADSYAICTTDRRGMHLWKGAEQDINEALMPSKT